MPSGSGEIGRRKMQFAWALYDWANSGFATSVMAGFFPLFFKQYCCAGVDAAVSTARLGWVVSAAAFAVAVIAPFAAAAADAAGIKKKVLDFFTVFGAVTTALLAVPDQGQWILASFLYLAAVTGFSAANIFYDALLPAVAGSRRRHRVSSLGFALGYLGGGLLFAINIAMVMRPGFFMLGSVHGAVKASFVGVAAWWLVFSVPLFLLVREPVRLKRESVLKLVTVSLQRLKNSFSGLLQLRSTLFFLGAYWFYMDGVSSVIRMAVDYGLSIGLGTSGLMGALLLVQAVGVPSTLLMGRIAERLGARRVVLATILLYVGVVISASRLTGIREFFLLAAVVGSAQGGIQALSRSLFASMIPRGEEAGFFGFYNITGRFSAVAGPALVGMLTLWSGSARTGILALVPLFVAGGVLLFVSGRIEAASANGSSWFLNS